MPGVEHLEFADARDARTGQDMQPYLLCRDRRKGIDLLMSDRLGPRHRLPGLAVPDFHRIAAHRLPFVQPLHRQRAVEGHRLTEVHFQRGAARVGGGGPEAVAVAVERALGVLVGLRMPVGMLL